MNTKLYVGNIPFDVTAQDLQDLFAQHGSVAGVDLISDKFTGRSRGFAFVTMASSEDANKAIQNLHGHAVEGRNLTVNEARPKEERAPRSFGGGGGGGGERRGGFGGGGGGGERRGGGFGGGGGRGGRDGGGRGRY
jgi:cold-inducible RNA-binding protein